MKKYLFLLVLISFSYGISAQSGDVGSGGINPNPNEGYSKEDCNVRNITIANIDSTNLLYEYWIEDKSKGVINLHPFSIEDIGSWENFTNSIKSDTNITFVYTQSETSRLFTGVYHRFQQYYKNIEVIDGVFTIMTENHEDDVVSRPGPPCEGCPPIDPCKDEVALFSPHIYENISIPVTPTISILNIGQSLDTPTAIISVPELKIVHNLTKNCEYKLVYKIAYVSEAEGDMIGWVDAHSGQLLHKHSPHDFKNAPTADHGVKFMNDSQSGSNTLLRNSRLKCYDMPMNSRFNIFNTNDIPQSPSNRDWNNTDANPEAFQLFWMADEVLDVFANNLGVNFVDVHVGFHPGFVGAVSFVGGTPNTSSYFTFGGNFSENNLSGVEYDVIGHEFGHAYIRQFISGDFKEGGSLHEGLSDIFGTYIESILEGSIDWAMGDNIPELGRDLQNTTKNCFNNIKLSELVHDRGEPLGHWFYLCVNGSVADNITPMDIDEFMMLLMEAVGTLGSNADYPDLMRATIDLAANKYFTCSDQFRTILKAWEKICVSTGHRMANPNAPCADLVGSTQVCEEYNTIQLCISSNAGVNADFADWTITGRNSTDFKSVRGMTGNSQYGGSCISINKIPDMPFYPQTITIQCRYPDLNGNYITVSKRVRIMDCLNDDLTCHEYYNGSSKQGSKDTDITLAETDNHKLNDNIYNESLKLIIYDLMGNVVEQSNIQYLKDLNPRILIYTYWDSKGQLVKTKKVFVSE